MNFKKYGNTLTPESNNFKNIHHKEGSVASSMLFYQTQEKNSIYKSFINQKSDNYGTDNKKTGGLDFLMKFKKEQ